MVCTVPTDKSGIPMVIFNLLKAFDRSDMQIGYVSINEPDEFFRKELDSLGVTLHVIPRTIKKSLGYISALAKVARDYDVMHVHGNSATMVLEMIAARIAGVKGRMTHSHNTSCNLKKVDALARPLFYRLCNMRVACGDAAGKWLFRNRDFHILNNGIDTAKFRFNPEKRVQIRQELNIKDSETVVGHIGNFLEVKNHRFILSVFREFLEIVPESRLLLCGNGPLMDEMKEMATTLGISERVIFAGSIPNPQDYMQAMDTIIMPSHYEGFPLTMVEEQANGLPILAADTITDKTNLADLVTFKSLDEGADVWANELYRIISKAERTTECSDKAIKKIISNKYDITEVARELKDLYNSATNAIVRK